jgi:hypothetical protein
MSKTAWCAILILALGLAAPAHAQFREKPADAGGTKLGASQVSRWRAGMTIKASGGPCSGLHGYVPIPKNWPEQEVTVVDEEKSPGVNVTYENVDEGARVMRVRVGQLPAGHEVKAIVTIEIRRSIILPPDNTDDFKLPDLKKLPAKVKPYLSPSPLIESLDPKIRDLAREIGADQEKAWNKVEAIYDWVREKVKYQNGPVKGAKAALKDGTGDCEELSSLFIAICRAANIPARTVWVDGHCYSEFYLEDAEGKGRWFPCQSAGKREFGGITELRPILQKGDNFRAPKGVEKRQRYMAEYLTGNSKGGHPEHRFIREAVAK